MSKFLTELEVENATAVDDGNWRLLAPLVYQSDVAGQIFTVPAGMVTNFASVPRIPVAFLLFGATSSEAAALHDGLYTYQWVSRAMSDAVLKEASAVTGVAAWRRWAMYLGVRAFGGSHWGSGPVAPAAK